METGETFLHIYDLKGVKHYNYLNNNPDHFEEKLPTLITDIESDNAIELLSKMIGGICYRWIFFNGEKIIL